MLYCADPLGTSSEGNLAHVYKRAAEVSRSSPKMGIDRSIGRPHALTYLKYFYENYTPIHRAKSFNSESYTYVAPSFVKLFLMLQL